MVLYSGCGSFVLNPGIRGLAMAKTTHLRLNKAKVRQEQQFRDNLIVRQPKTVNQMTAPKVVDSEPKRVESNQSEKPMPA